MHLNVSLTAQLLARPGKIPPIGSVLSRRFLKPIQDALVWCTVQPTQNYSNTLPASASEIHSAQMLTAGLKRKDRKLTSETIVFSPHQEFVLNSTDEQAAGRPLPKAVVHDADPAIIETPNTGPAGNGALPPKDVMKERTVRKRRAAEPMGEAQIAFLHFIATGSLPASERRWTLTILQQQLHEQMQREHHFYGAPAGEDAFCLKLLALLLENPNALPRLLMQAGEGLLEDLYAHTMENGIVNRWVGWFSDLPGLDTRTLRWKTLLLSLSYTGGHMSLENYPKVEKGIVLYLLREMQPPQLFRLVQQMPATKLQKMLGVLEIPYTPELDITDVLSTLRAQASQLLPPEARDIASEPSPTNSPAVPDTYVENAGLVLLGSFLPHLFQDLGWMDGLTFTHESLCQRAVLLTQYLVDPAESVPEYLLGLNKLLCGYPRAHTLPLCLEDDSSQERAKAIRLLQAVLKQWTVNGQAVNPTIQSLRESFLQRRGKLVRRENDWLLYVEQKACDLLLNSITWNIRMIQLPWMKEVLWVEWV